MIFHVEISNFCNLLLLWSVIVPSLDDKYVVGLVQERRNSIANTLELRLSCTNPSMCIHFLPPELLVCIVDGTYIVHVLNMLW